jgi:hypothetical protein
VTLTGQTDPLNLLDLQQAASLAQKYVDDRPNFFEELDAKRKRIEAGYAKVEDAATRGASPEVLQAAKTKIESLERELATSESAIEIPWYFTAALLMMTRDSLKWSCVPKGSTVTVELPGVYKLAVRLDSLPLEPPF